MKVARIKAGISISGDLVNFDARALKPSAQRVLYAGKIGPYDITNDHVMSEYRKALKKKQDMGYHIVFLHNNARKLVLIR
jgi:hypothetical protein